MKVQLNVTRDTMVDCESKRFNQWLIVASQNTMVEASHKYNGWPKRAMLLCACRRKHAPCLPVCSTTVPLS